MPIDLASIRIVLFDLDGTLTVPVLDFPEIRQRLGIAPGANIVETMATLKPGERAAKESALREIELETATRARPNTGATEIVTALRARNIKVAVVTRNFRQATAITLERLGMPFDVAITRDDAPVKPSPECVTEALRQLGATTVGALMVGDGRDDIAAGRAAGVPTCLVTNGGPRRAEADMYVDSPAILLQAFDAAWAALRAR